MKATGKKPRLLALLIPALGASVALSSCNFEYEKKSSDTTSLRNLENPGYDDIRAAIIEPRCLSCHVSQAPVLTSYENIVANIRDIENSALVRFTMPKNRPLTNDQQAMLRTWIRNGMPREGSNPLPAPKTSGGIPRPYTYADLKTRVIDPKCASCHFAKNPDGITSLETYAETMSVEALIPPLIFGIMGEEVVPEKERMPPPDSAPLTDAEKAEILLWYNDGKLEK